MKVDSLEIINAPIFIMYSSINALHLF